MKKLYTHYPVTNIWRLYLIYFESYLKANKLFYYYFIIFYIFYFIIFLEAVKDEINFFRNFANSIGNLVQLWCIFCQVGYYRK